jgi:hypothetical protein
MNASCFPQNPWCLNGYRAALARSSYPKLSISRPESIDSKVKNQYTVSETP